MLIATNRIRSEKQALKKATDQSVTDRRSAMGKNELGKYVRYGFALAQRKFTLAVSIHRDCHIFFMV